MALVYNTRSVRDMDDETRLLLSTHGIDPEWYISGKVRLGPIGKSAITKFAILNTNITKYDLPLPPSRFTEMIVDRTTGKSKQDFREIIDGAPGGGKSYSAMYACGRYGIEAAERYGQDPKDYFTLKNAVLLQDTEGVTHLMDELDKEQAVLIDDAGIAAGNREYFTQNNRNLSAIMQTCRTKRWYVVFTAPMNKHLDLAIRELVYCKASITKPCHAAQFNIIRQKGMSFYFKDGKQRESNPHYIFDGAKVGLYAYFSPDLLDPYKGIVKKYDILRDEATDELIHQRAENSSELKNPVDKREKRFKNILESNLELVFKLTHDNEGKWLNRRELGKTKQENTYSVGAISAETGLNNRQINKIIAHLKQSGR